jgi:hypothetical protein
LDRQRAQETGILCESDHEVAVAMLSRPLNVIASPFGVDGQALSSRSRCRAIIS